MKILCLFLTLKVPSTLVAEVSYSLTSFLDLQPFSATDLSSLSVLSFPLSHLLFFHLLFISISLHLLSKCSTITDSTFRLVGRITCFIRVYHAAVTLVTAAVIHIFQLQ